MKVILDEDELKRGVDNLASQISSLYQKRPLTIVAVMTGSVVLLADIIRLLSMPLRVGVVQAASYQGDQRGELKINSELMPDISQRDVLLIDDIFDTGHTLELVVQTLAQFSPKSIRSAVLLKKTGRTEVDYDPDFVGFEIPDKFVVGYGLDFNDEYRNLPFLAVLDETDLLRHQQEQSHEHESQSFKTKHRSNP
ncbi:MAG: hypoxanthine phosphoribosyltransferase [Planctomycetota bacterium]|nr:hypoxanthine phosphoribosyltransferase [Planctomycetota bacterium]